MRRFLYFIAHLEILAVSAVLLWAFWIQFVDGELACPLCVVQRVAMLLCLLGPAVIITDGLRQRDVSSGAVMAGYGMSILGAVVGLIASSRQVLLHILVLWILGIIILANAVAVFCEAGLHLYLPDNPTSYRLFSGS